MTETIAKGAPEDATQIPEDKPLEPQEELVRTVEGEIVEERMDETLLSALQEENQALRDEVEAARTQSDEYLDGWQRARAEFANYKKRIEREQAQVYQNAASAIIKRYLDILDDLERALKNRPQDGEGAAWASGIDLIYRKLITVLESEGITPMQGAGAAFDPNLHEAISLEENSQYESGQIIEVIRQGYQLGDRVVRPAIVRVAK
jgi:molecular chaperone GrpE